MSAGSAFGSAVASTAVPMFAAAVSSPLPPELGLGGQIADEQTRLQNAKAWLDVVPPVTGLAALVVFGVGTYCWLGEPRRRPLTAVE